MYRILLFITIFALIGCGGSESTSSTPATTVSNAIPSTFFTTQRPTDVKDLVEVKNSAKTGDKVTFLARIGGRKNASFVSSISMMIVADPGLVSCELMGEEEHCATPEDYCCEDPEFYSKGLGTVRFMDAAGDIYPFSVEGEHGMEVLKYVVVDGTVVDINANGLFIVDANKVWVGGKPSYGNQRGGSGE